MRFKTIAQANEATEILATSLPIREDGEFRNDGTYWYMILVENQTAKFERYFRLYEINEDGDVSYTDYMPIKEPGDESFDVVVEEKLKEEKNVELDEIYRDAIREYIRNHRQELKEYSDESKARFFVASFEDSLSDILEEAIDDHWNDYDFDNETDVGLYEIREILDYEGILE